MKKQLSIVLALILSVSALSGCTGKGAKTNEVTQAGKAVNLLADTVSDSSELPDWTGKKLDVVKWYGAGQASVKRGKKATENVVGAELARVTGVNFSEASFDNGDEMMDAKLAKIVATKEWPDVLEEPSASVLEKIIGQGLAWDLTDYIPKYMPHLQKMIEQGGENPFLRSQREDGKLYWIQINPKLSYKYPDMDPQIRARAQAPVSPISFVYVRDDILKQIYPDALTQDDLDAIYLQNGSFTREQLLNCAFESPEEFYDFLYKVKALNIKKGNREVFPIYACDGTDNWMLMSYLGCLYGRFVHGLGGANYFTYYDKQTKQVEYMFKQDFFKKTVSDWAELVQKGVASLDSLVDNRAAFEQKVANGEYAVLYGGNIPEIETINEQGNPYDYRKVYINVPVDESRFLVTGPVSGGNHFVILKPNVSEEDLIQILQYFDFMMTDTGSKLTYWGPKSAGLFTEDENGVRRYVDAELENCMVYGEENEKALYYGLKNTYWPGYPMADTKFDPRITYESDPTRGNAMTAFNMGTLETPKITVAESDSITNFAKQNIPEVNKFWNARTAFEVAMTKTLTAKDAAEFETLYASVIQTAERNGLTDDLLPKLTDIYLNKINKHYANNIK